VDSLSADNRTKKRLESNPNRLIEEVIKSLCGQSVQQGWTPSPVILFLKHHWSVLPTEMTRCLPSIRRSFTNSIYSREILNKRLAQTLKQESPSVTNVSVFLLPAHKQQNERQQRPRKGRPLSALNNTPVERTGFHQRAFPSSGFRAGTFRSPCRGARIVSLF